VVQGQGVADRAFLVRVPGTTSATPRIILALEVADFKLRFFVVSLLFMSSDSGVSAAANLVKANRCHLHSQQHKCGDQPDAVDRISAGKAIS
jgi:hypothetical protein